jgi:hypothetical protein
MQRALPMAQHLRFMLIELSENCQEAAATGGLFYSEINQSPMLGRSSNA